MSDERRPERGVVRVHSLRSRMLSEPDRSTVPACQGETQSERRRSGAGGEGRASTNAAMSMSDERRPERSGATRLTSSGHCQAELFLGCVGPVDEGHDLAFEHHRDAVGEPEDLVEVLGDHHDRAASGALGNEL